MELVKLTLLILKLNALCDSENYDHVTLTEVKDHIRDGDLFPWMEQTFETTFGSWDEGDKRAINDTLEATRSAYAGEEGRRWGVNNRGLCLLVAWVNEMVQQGQFVRARRT